MLNKMVITIVGIGQIGGSFALALRKKGIGRKIIGVDVKEVISNPHIKKIVDYPTSNLEPAIKKADFIFLATPVLTIIKLLPKIVSNMKTEAILLDSGSTKKEICMKMKEFPEHILIGGHPIAGTEKAGFGSASSSLFENKVFTLTFPTEKSLKGKNLILKLLKNIGALALEIDAESHDYIISLTSHLPYILSITLSLLAKNQIKRNYLFKKLIGSGFLSITRLSITHGEMGVGILKTNSEQVIDRIEEFSEKIKEIKILIEKGHRGEIETLLSDIKKFQINLRKG